MKQNACDSQIVSKDANAMIFVIQMKIHKKNFKTKISQILKMSSFKVSLVHKSRWIKYQINLNQTM